MAVLQVYLDENGKQSDHHAVSGALEPFLQSVQRHVADAGEQLQESYVWFRAKRSSTESGMRRA